MITDNDIKKLKTVFLTKDEAKKFATKDDLKVFATKEDLKRFATKDDLKMYATKEDLKMYATKEDLKKSASDTVVGLTEFIGEVYEKLAAKIDLILADNKDSRNTLDTHERRIERLEEQVYTTTTSS